MEYSSNLMISVLRKEYPEIAQIITRKIKDTLPRAQLTDLSNIEKIISTFKREKQVKTDNWTNGKGRANITYKRDLLVAVLLLFYDPEKIMQLVRRNTVPGIMKQASMLIGTSQEVLSMSTPGVIVAFKAYEEFREEVYRLYDLIRREHGFFE